MATFSFKKWNVITGWCVFAIALLTYSLTVEPTTSFWDAAEYITTSSNLEVGHPPGAPLYQTMGAFFSTFAFGDVTNIALMVNMMSVFASAFTILFMFWSLTLLMKKILSKETLSTKNEIVILGSAAIGALTFTFTDSFWYSAVEAEVYAMATLLIALLFYIGLLWERDMHKPRGNRWLILISFILGLSFGVHFMALLTIPAIGLLFYFKNYKITIKSFIVANIAVVAVLMFIFLFLLPMTMRFFSASELFFINTIGLPFHSGTIIAGLVMIGLFYYLLKYTKQRKYPIMNTAVLCVLFVFIGFSSWIMLPIRANAGTTINQNNPGDAQELLSYYNREQYGGPSLFYNPYFSEIYAGLDENNPYKDGKPNYQKDEKRGKYIIVNNYKNAEQNLDDAHKGFFTRMWSQETKHIVNYMSMYTGPLDFSIKREYMNQQLLVDEVARFKKEFAEGMADYEDYHNFLRQFGEYLDVEKPTFGENLHYLFDYQFGKMYLRYFMWNFAGRQNDKQWEGDVFNGNWLSGIKPIDEFRLGSQENLPSDVKNNKGRNTYFFLPLILGLIGLLYHYDREKTTFWVLAVLFLFTGLALKVYLNERPFEPRERDYALVGSFYVFAMWIGFGVYALYEIVQKYLKPKLAIPLTLSACLLAVPVLMASENWDDHDRSGKYTARAIGKAYLDSMDKNGIIFTIGDNDTFALWYMQSVEGYRTDIRVVNTSLFYADWYINDMKKKAYESDPIPSQLKKEQYRGTNRDFIYYQEVTKDTVPIKLWMDWVADDSDRTTGELPSGQEVHTYPSKNIRIPVDKEKVLQNGIVDEKDADLIVPYIDITIPNDVLYKNRILMLDMLANNNWERPIYFSGGSYDDGEYIWLKDYLQLDGMVYKLVPIKKPVDRRNPFDMGRIDTEKMYNIVMSWEWGNSDSTNIYHDPETRRNSISYRNQISRLADQLIKEGKTEKAKEVVDLVMEKLPVEYYEYYTLVEPFVKHYFRLGEKEKAIALYDQLAEKYQEKLFYFSTLSYAEQNYYFEEIYLDIERYRSLVTTLLYSEDEELIRSRGDVFNEHLNLFKHFFGEEDSIDSENEFLDIPQDDSIDMEAIEGASSEEMDGVEMEP